MGSEVEGVVSDIFRFAELLKLAGLPALAEGYESLGGTLRSDPSEQMLTVAREWVGSTYQYKGSGSIYDRYIPGEEFGSVNYPLTDEYHVLAKKMNGFARQESGSAS